MANSKLLKDAIADAKTVRETAIANAKIALEEAFTPRLQSILSQKLQTEMEDEEEEDEDVNEEYGSEDAPTGQSSSIGKGENGTESGTDGKQPSGDATQSHTDLDPETGKISDKVGTEDDNVEVVNEDEQQDDDNDGVIDDPTGATYNESEDEEDVDFGSEEEEDEDELDLESIIRELESEIGDDEEEEVMEDEDEEDESGEEVFVGAGDDEGISDIEDEPVADAGMEDDDEMEIEDEEEDDDIDLDEILREMGYGDDEEDSIEESEDDEAYAEKEAELEEAYKVIKSLKGTINEVNLLNAKLLYSNKLFRNYEMTNEQKMKVVETLDRTANVREVKLVFATLAESLKYGNGTKKKVRKITENFASNTVQSTAPSKEIINESNDFAERFKKLANIGQNK